VQEGQSGLLTAVAAFCQMVSFLFGCTELSPPPTESLLGLMSVVSAEGSTEGEEQRGNILSMWENGRKCTKSGGSLAAWPWFQSRKNVLSSPLSRAGGCSFADTSPRGGMPC